ncbi:hypothetical protein [Escherichia coli]|uniref:hypothetical protein n=1 Tax=Escherichia coli TaxID=562 RepID=UPI0030F3E614
MVDSLVRHGYLSVGFFDRDNNGGYHSLMQYYSLTELALQLIKMNGNGEGIQIQIKVAKAAFLLHDISESAFHQKPDRQNPHLIRCGYGAVCFA